MINKENVLITILLLESEKKSVCTMWNKCDNWNYVFKIYVLYRKAKYLLKTKFVLGKKLLNQTTFNQIIESCSL